MDESDDKALRRCESRLRTDLPAQLVTLTGAPRVSLCDLSCLHCTERLPSGAEGVLNWLQFEAVGKLV